LNAIQVLSQLSYTPDYYNQIIKLGVFKLVSIRRRRNIKEGRGACQ